MENCLYLYFELVLRKNRIYYIYIEENKIHQVLNFKKILRWFDHVSLEKHEKWLNKNIYTLCTLWFDPHTQLVNGSVDS